MKPAGNVNAFITMRARIGNVSFTFDGTTLDLGRQALKHGAKVGTVITSELGKHVMAHNPHETRLPKIWPDRIWD